MPFTGLFWKILAVLISKPPAVAGEPIANLMLSHRDRSAISGALFKLDKRVEKPDKAEHAFSIELRSKQHLKSVNVGVDGSKDQVFIEGSLEESMLEVSGRKGTLRLDVSWEDLSHIVKAGQHGGNVL